MAVPAGCKEMLVEATRVARRLVSRDDNARAAVDDLAHDVLVRAIEHPPPDGKMGPWLERIGRNLSIDRWRAAARGRLPPGELDAGETAPTSEEAVLALERRRNVRSAVLSLPRDQRRAVILRYHAGWSFEQIAARLGVMTATARTRVFRGVALLRRQLGGLRAVLAPGTFTLKPVILALVVVTVDLRMLPVAARQIPQVIDVDSGAPQPKVRRRARTLVVATASSPAVAVPPAADEPRRVKHPTTQRFDFEDDEVTGELGYGNGEYILLVPNAVHSSLIELREEFVPEMLKSLEDL